MMMIKIIIINIIYMCVCVCLWACVYIIMSIVIIDETSTNIKSIIIDYFDQVILIIN